MASTTKKTTITPKVVDFTNVKEQGAFRKGRVPSGDYLAQVMKVEDAPAKGDGVHQYLFTIKLKKFSQNKYPFYCKLQENQLWKLRNLFIAAGINVPKKRTKVDPTKVVGKLIGVTMEDDEYEGRAQSEIAAVFPASELEDTNLEDADDSEDSEDDEDYSMDDSDDESEETEDDAEEEEDEEESDQFENMDRTQLKAWLKAQDDAFQAKKSQSDDDLRELARSIEGNAEDGDEEEEEEEPEPEPALKPKAKKKAKAKKAAPADDDEDLEELDLEDL